MVDKESVMRSFAKVKEDISKLQANLLDVSGTQAEVFQMISELKNSLDKLSKEKSPPRKEK